MFFKSQVMSQTLWMKAYKGHSKWQTIFSDSKEFISALIVYYQCSSERHYIFLLVFAGNEPSSNSLPVLQQSNFSLCLLPK